MNFFQTEGMRNFKKILSYSFSNQDIKNYLGDDTKILEYKDLNNYTSIDELLHGERDFVVILIETSDKNGHWTVLLKYDGILEWMDSYGLGVDKELGFIKNSIRKLLGEEVKQLTYLIDTSPYDCIYNHIQLQSHKSFVSTCGRWVVDRILHFKKGLNLKEYIDYLNFFIHQNNLKGPLKYDLIVIKEVPYVPK